MTDYQTILNKIKESYVEILGNNLVGLYVHGSIAFNCFNWAKSDIDYIAVVDETVGIETKLELMKSTVELNKTAPQKGLEMSVVLKRYCLDFIYPTPFELHFSNMHLNRYNTGPREYCEAMNGDDEDLAAHFTVIKAVGIVLYGADINNVFGDIPRDYYLDSLKYDIENANDSIIANGGIIENPVYIILNLCRVLAYVNDGLILSKEQGGKWGLANTDSRFGELIISALNSYTSDNTMAFDKDNEKARLFCDYMRNKIFG